MDSWTSPGGRRERLHRLLTIAVGLALGIGAVGQVSAAAATRALEGAPPTGRVLGDVVAPLMSGAGSITSATAGLSCQNLAGTAGVPVPCLDNLTLAELTGVGTVELVPAAAGGWVFTGWSGTGCQQIVGTHCVVDTSTLGTLLEPLRPVATFVELPPLCGALPLPCDSSAPYTRLTSWPTLTSLGTTAGTSATIGFAAYDDSAAATPTTGATFECRLTRPGQPAPDAWTACASPQRFADLGGGSHTFAVRAVDPSGNVDVTEERFSWTVDRVPPQTVLTSAPGRWVLTKRAHLAYSGSEPGGDFLCTFDGGGRSCGTTGVGVRFRSGTHTFAVQARDQAGNVDPTPATVTFTLPRNNNALAHRGWTQRRGQGYFLDTYSMTRRRGATLTAERSTRISRVALVVTTGRGFGSVKVMLGKQRLATVSLDSRRTRHQKVVEVAHFSKPRVGKVRVIAVTGGRKVVVEGLGIASRP